MNIFDIKPNTIIKRDHLVDMMNENLSIYYDDSQYYIRFELLKNNEKCCIIYEAFEDYIENHEVFVIFNKFIEVLE